MRKGIKRKGRQETWLHACDPCSSHHSFNRRLCKENSFRDHKDPSTDSTAWTVYTVFGCMLHHDICVLQKCKLLLLFSIFKHKRVEHTSALRSTSRLLNVPWENCTRLLTLFILYYLLKVMLHCEKCFGDWTASGFPRAAACIIIKTLHPLFHSFTGKTESFGIWRFLLYWILRTSCLISRDFRWLPESRKFRWR